MINYKVSLITSNYNGKEFLNDYLDSVKKQNYPLYEWIIVDNNSTDGSPEIIKRADPRIKLIVSKKNLGCAGGQNLGMKAATGDIFLMLDNDVIIHPDLISILIKELMASPDIGMVGCKVYQFNDPKRILYAGGFIDWKRFEIIHIGKGLTDSELVNDAVKDVDFIVGCCLMLKKEVYQKTKGYFEPYFAYFEDMDLCFQARRAGFRTLYIPFGGVWHIKSATEKKFYFKDLDKELPAAGFIKKIFLKLKIYYRWLFFYIIGRKGRIYKNRLIFFIRWASFKNKFIFLVRYLFIETPQFVVFLIIEVPKKIIQQLKTRNLN